MKEKKQVYVVTVTFTEEYYADSLDEIETVKDQIQQDYADYIIKDMSVSNQPEERDLYV